MNVRLIIVLLSAILIYTANIWGLSVYVLDEAKNAGCAMEMYQKNEWIVPVFNGHLRTDKPVLHYYFMRSAYAVFGVNPFSARLFSSLMGVMTVVSIFFFTRKIAGERSAFYSSLIFLASMQLAVQFHLAVPDPYLLFFFTFGWLSFYYGIASGRRLFLYLFYLSISLAFLTKGPVALIFSGLIVLIFLLLTKRMNLKHLSALRIFEGALIFCLIGLPWYIMVGIKTQGEWIDQFFFRHNIGRFTNTMEGHGGFPLASFVILFGGLMPFSFFIPQSIRMIWREWNTHMFLKYCSIVALTVSVFFAFSSTILPTYPEPAFAFVAIILGMWFSKLVDGSDVGIYPWVSAAFYLLISVIIPVVAFVALKQDKSLSDLASLSFWFLILPAGAIPALIFILKRKYHHAVLSYACSVVVFLLIFFYVIFPVIDMRSPVVSSHDLIDSRKPIVAYRDFNPAYVFAIGHAISQLESCEELTAFLAAHEEVYILTEASHLEELKPARLDTVFLRKNLFEDPITVVLGKHKIDE